MAAPRIVVVGANFAGLKAAQTLGRDHKVTVVDPSPFFEWLPNIHELISAVKRPAHSVSAFAVAASTTRSRPRNHLA